MIQLGVHLHQFTNINAAHHVRIIIIEGVRDFHPLPRRRQYLANKNETRRITRSENHLLHIRQPCRDKNDTMCLRACYNMFLPQSGGLKNQKTKKEQRSASATRLSQLSHASYSYMSPLMPGVMVGVRLYSSQKLCIRMWISYKGWPCKKKISLLYFMYNVHIDRREGLVVHCIYTQLRTLYCGVHRRHCHTYRECTLEQMRGLYKFRFQYNISQMCTSAERVRNVCTQAHIWTMHKTFGFA